MEDVHQAVLEKFPLLFLRVVGQLLESYAKGILLIPSDLCSALIHRVQDLTVDGQVAVVIPEFGVGEQGKLTIFGLRRQDGKSRLKRYLVLGIAHALEDLITDLITKGIAYDNHSLGIDPLELLFIEILLVEDSFNLQGLDSVILDTS